MTPEPSKPSANEASSGSSSTSTSSKLSPNGHDPTAKPTLAQAKARFRAVAAETDPLLQLRKHAMLAVAGAGAAGFLLGSSQGVRKIITRSISVAVQTGLARVIGGPAAAAATAATAATAKAACHQADGGKSNLDLVLTALLAGFASGRGSKKS